VRFGWLPEPDTDPNTRMENFGGVTFSRLLTRTGIRRCVQHLDRDRQQPDVRMAPDRGPFSNFRGLKPGPL
jgi:hypothetical protein